MYVAPSREEVVQVMQDLIASQAEPLQASLWAEKIYHPQNIHIYEKLKKQDPALLELMDGIIAASEEDGSGKKLYGTEDYENWLKEFLDADKD